MLKRIIFDLDNTLIMWKDEYRFALKRTIELFNVDINYIEVDNIIEIYEDYYDHYTRENMLNLINQKFSLNLDITFIDKWLEELANMANIEDNVISTLEYLSQKYELVILTNWFKSSQKSRMKKVGIDKYFKEIYGGDEFIKPSIQSYAQAIGDKLIEECIMIGDNYKVDIEGANKFGMKAIMITNKDIKENDNFKVISNIEQLKEIL